MRATMEARNRYEILPCGRAVVYLMGAGGEHATLIDAADLPLVLSAPGKWYAQRRRWTIYAACTFHANGRKHTIRLHRFLTGCPPDKEVDHADHDGLHNTRANMRIVTPEENKASARPWGEGVDVWRWYEVGCETLLKAVPDEDFLY